MGFFVLHGAKWMYCKTLLKGPKSSTARWLWIKKNWHTYSCGLHEHREAPRLCYHHCHALNTSLVQRGSHLGVTTFLCPFIDCHQCQKRGQHELYNCPKSTINKGIHRSICLIYSRSLLPQLYSPCKEWSAARPWEGETVMALGEKTANRWESACMPHKTEIAIEQPFPHSTWRKKKNTARGQTTGWGVRANALAIWWH